MVCVSFKYLKGVACIFVNRLFRQMCMWKGGVCEQPRPLWHRESHGQDRLQGNLAHSYLLRSCWTILVQLNLPSQLDTQTETIKNLQSLSYTTTSPYHQSFNNCEHRKQWWNICCLPRIPANHCRTIYDVGPEGFAVTEMKPYFHSSFWKSHVPVKRKKKVFWENHSRTLYHTCQHITQGMSYKYIPTLFSVLQ